MATGLAFQIPLLTLSSHDLVVVVVVVVVVVDNFLLPLIPGSD